MTPYMGCSSRYGIPHIAKTPPYLSQTTSSENSKAIVPSHAAENASHPINSVSSQCLLPGEPLKRRRSRRGRTRDYYAKAIAAFSTIYPKVFSSPGGVCPLVKIKPGSPTEEAELLQELPALISPLKQADYEVPVLLSKFPNEYDSPSSPQAEMPTWNSAMPARNSGPQRQASESPGFDPQAEEDSCVVPEECVVVESLLDSNNSLPDGDGGLDGIMGGAGDSNSVPGDTSSPAGVFGDYGDREHLADERSYYYSAIRALRRRQWHTDCCRGDDVASGHVAPWSMSLADKIKAEKEMNTMSFCSLDWLKRDGQHGLSLKLNYEEILSAWSDRGSLYIDEQSPQTVPGGDDDDAVDSAMASVDVGLVPHLNLWGVEGENVIECSHRAEDGCAVEDGTKTGMREARVLRYKEKRQTRLFSRKIRYQVRKINAERRPRMKGRFVRRLVDL